MYLPDHFKLEELVSQDFFEKNTEADILKKFDPNVLKAADWIKETFSINHPVTINNWLWGGNRQYSGLRRPGDDFYSPTSMHSTGKAIDMVFKNISAEEIRNEIKRLISKGYDIPYIKRIENGVSWLHIDTKETGLKEVYFFNP